MDHFVLCGNGVFPDLTRSDGLLLGELHSPGIVEKFMQSVHFGFGLPSTFMKSTLPKALSEGHTPSLLPCRSSRKVESGCPHAVANRNCTRH